MSEREIEVHYFAGLIDLAGVRQERFQDVTDLEGLKEAIVERHGPGIEKSIAVSSFMADGERLKNCQSLEEVTKVEALPPFAGG